MQILPEVRGTESPAQIDAHHDLLDRLERIRRAGLARMNMKLGPATPIIGVIAPPADYVDHLTGQIVRAADVDLISRLQFMQRVARATLGRTARRILEGTVFVQTAHTS